MRDLQTQDLFSAARVISEIGLKDELREICKKSNNVADVWGRGFDFIYLIFEKAATKGAEEKIYEFLAPIMEKTPEEIKTGNLDEMIELLADEQNVRKWKAFFTKLARLIGLK